MEVWDITVQLSYLACHCLLFCLGLFCSLKNAPRSIKTVERVADSTSRDDIKLFNRPIVFVSL